MKNKRLTGGFGMISNIVMRNPNISLRDKGLYAYLATYADVNNELTVSIRRISNECNINESTVRRILKNLQKQKIIERIKRSHAMSFKTILLI